MKQSERDELLIRLSERTNNIWRTLEEMNGHFKRLNDSVTKHSIGIAVNKKLIGGIFAGILALILRGAGIY